MTKNLMKWIVPIVVLFNACKKDDTRNQPDPIAPTKGVYVLSEGRFSYNNTKLSYRPVSTGLVSGDFFLQQNPSITGGLGDTGNDMIIYGGKMYIVVNNSGVVTVLNAANAVFLAQIDFGNTAANKNPRNLTGIRGKVFVTAWDNKVSVIDTSSLAITGTIAVGSTPEGIISSGGYLYVANSGGSNYPDFDSTVSVIDLNTLTEVKKITVGINPQKLAVNSAGDIYVTGYGNYGSVPAFVSVINGTTNTFRTTLGSGYEFSNVRIFDNIAYFYNNYGGGTVKVYNTVTNSVVRNNFIADGTIIDNAYGVNFDEENGDVYIADAKDNVTAGSVTCFDKNGIKKFDFSVAPGISPNKILFLR